MISIVGHSKKSSEDSAYYTLLVYDFEFTTPCWSVTSSLLHLNQFFFFWGGQGPHSPPPQYANDHCMCEYV